MVSPPLPPGYHLFLAKAPVVVWLIQRRPGCVDQVGLKLVACTVSVPLFPVKEGDEPSRRVSLQEKRRLIHSSSLSLLRPVGMLPHVRYMSWAQRE